MFQSEAMSRPLVIKEMLAKLCYCKPMKQRHFELEVSETLLELFTTIGLKARISIYLDIENRAKAGRITVLPSHVASRL
jgi:hypothetical protein